MTKTTITADHYNHRNDLRFHLGKADEAIRALSMLVEAAEEIDLEDVTKGIEYADALRMHAGQILNYVVGLARFEGATWADVGEALGDVTKQAASERFRHLAKIPRRGQVLGTLTAE